MENCATIPMNGTKDETNLKRLLSSMNDREIQEVYTHIRIINISEDILWVANEMLDCDSITYDDFTIIEKHQEDLAIHFMDIHDWNIPDHDLMASIIEAFLDDMHNRPVEMIACHNHNIFIRKYKNLVEASKAMRYAIHDIMVDYNISLDVSMPSYTGVNCGWDSKSGWLYYDGDNYDWKIVYESDIPTAN